MTDPVKNRFGVEIGQPLEHLTGKAFGDLFFKHPMCVYTRADGSSRNILQKTKQTTLSQKEKP